MFQNRKQISKNIYFAKYVDWFYWKSYDTFLLLLLQNRKKIAKNIYFAKYVKNDSFFSHCKTENKSQKKFILLNMLIDFIEKVMTLFFLILFLLLQNKNKSQKIFVLPNMFKMTLFFCKTENKSQKLFILSSMLIDFIEKAITLFFCYCCCCCKTENKSHKIFILPNMFKMTLLFCKTENKSQKYLFWQICWFILLKKLCLVTFENYSLSNYCRLKFR